MIEIKNFSKFYGRQQVLDNVDLKIPANEIHGLLGISGAGKSTLLRCINGLESYERGSLKVFGLEVGQLKGRRLNEFRRRIGMIFQNFALLGRKTVLKNVLLPMECWKYSTAESHKRAERLLDLVGLLDKADCRPQELSGGQQQRVAIARTLTLEPELLLCDEATSALDPMTTQSILDLLKEIQSELKISMVVVTHQLEVVRHLCQYVSIMEKGRIAATDRVTDIFTDEPEALLRLTGQPDISIPAGRVGFKISLNPSQTNEPVLSDLALALKIQYTVLHARTDICRTDKIGNFYLSVDAGDGERVMAYCKDRKLDFKVLPCVAPQIADRDFQ